MILRKLDIGDQAMYNLRVIMQCLDQSTRMMSVLVVITLGVEMDVGHAINKIILTVERSGCYGIDSPIDEKSS